MNKYTSSLSAIIGGLAEDTKMVARHCRTNTTHNLCTPRRDAMIMKESRCELINSAKPEKGTPESIRVGYTLSAYLSTRAFFFCFSPFLQTGRVETFWFIPCSVCSYFFRSFSFIMQKIHRRLSAVSNSCVNVTLPSPTVFPFLCFLLNFKLHFSSGSEIFFYIYISREIRSRSIRMFAETDSRALFELN